MINLDIKKSLLNYGLNESEIKVYLALLELGTSTAREISLATKIKRTTVYLITDKLVEKGLLGCYKAKYGTHYMAIDPNLLISRIDNIKQEITNIIPQLKALEKKTVNEPSVKFYKGKEGYLTITNDSLNGYSYEVLYLGSAKDLNDIISEKYVKERYIPGRIKRKIKFKQIVFEDDFSVKSKKVDPQELRQTKFLPNNYDFKGSMFIYQNKVAYFSSPKELTAVLIESDDISEMERKKFELLWSKL